MAVVRCFNALLAAVCLYELHNVTIKDAPDLDYMTKIFVEKYDIGHLN